MAQAEEKSRTVLEIEVSEDLINFDEVHPEIEKQILDSEIKYTVLASETSYSHKASELIQPKVKWNINKRKRQRLQLKNSDHPIGKLIDEKASAPGSVRVSGGCPFENRKDGKPCGVSVLVKFKPVALKSQASKLISAHYPIDH